eukprot:scaffold7099_cov281-Pinguiococcus_pyrenoidosus.AAC.7
MRFPNAHNGETLADTKYGAPGAPLSCSDKIAMWNVLGIQGGRLSSVVRPLYLSSIVCGRKYHQRRLRRALCCRLQGFRCRHDFGLHHPALLCTAMRLSENVLEAADEAHGDLGVAFEESCGIWLFTNSAQRFRLPHEDVDAEEEDGGGAKGAAQHRSTSLEDQALDAVDKEQPQGLREGSDRDNGENAADEPASLDSRNARAGSDGRVEANKFPEGSSLILRAKQLVEAVAPRAPDRYRDVKRWLRIDVPADACDVRRADRLYVRRATHVEGGEEKRPGSEEKRQRSE